MNLISKRKVSWVSTFVVKVLIFLTVLNGVILPILLILRIPLTAYIPIMFFEGFCLMIIGGLLLFSSLFSTIERHKYRYVGDGFSRREVTFRELKGEEKRKMRQKGVVMIILGLFFWAAAFLVPFILI